MIIEFRSVRGEGTSTGISDKGPVLAMVMTWAAVVYATLTLLYWFCDSGYNYNRVPFLYFEHTRPWLPNTALPYTALVVTCGPNVVMCGAEK